MNEEKQLIKEFEEMKDKALIKVLHKKSVKEPLSDIELQNYKEAIEKVYGFKPNPKYDEQIRGENN